MKKLLLSLLLTLSFSTFANTATLKKAEFSQTGLAKTVSQRGFNQGLQSCYNNCNANAVNDCISGGGNVAVCQATAVEVCRQRCNLIHSGGYR